MKLTDIQQIIVVGAGTMGAGIAQMSALAGYPTMLYDIKENALTKAQQNIAKNLDGAIKRNKITLDKKNQAINNIKFTNDFTSLIGDFIIEAIIEKLDVKTTIFKQLAQQNASKTILATNTSSIPITRIAAQIPHPERVVGMHFFNPAHIMKLVEVISGAATHPQIAATTKALAEKMGKKAVRAADAPGFIVNRVARHFYVESLKILEEGIADIATIDALTKSCGFRMGAFELMDLIGVDTNFAVTQSMFESFHYESRFRPSRIQQQKVEAGHHGRKTGKGFYEY